MNTQLDQPYTRIARIYDDIMRDVDYEGWSDYIDEIIQYHHPDAVDLLELGCGTGGHAIKLEELECYRIVATDISPEMVRLAEEKASRLDAMIEFEVADFLNFQLNRFFDAIFLVFDSINYVHQPENLTSLFQSAENHLNPNGIFIFDFTTPSFSQKVEHSLNESSRRIDDIRYSRKSSWDPNNRMHTNLFTIETLDPQTGNVIKTEEETHRQKIHHPEEIESVIADSGLKVEARYSDFDFTSVDDETDRITMVLRKCPITR